MFKAKIVKKQSESLGHKYWLYSWLCPMCLEFEVEEDMSEEYVSLRVSSHLIDTHRIHPYRIVIKYKSKE